MPGPRRDPELPDLVSLGGAADILGIAKSYVHELHQSGKLPGVPVEGARYWAFRKAVVLELKAERAKQDKRSTGHGDS